MDFDTLQKLWLQQQQRLNTQVGINKKLLLNYIIRRSYWLAPNTIMLFIILTLCLAVTIAAIIFNQMYLSCPIILMCMYGYYCLWWQYKYKRKITIMRGGLIGMRKNLLKYKQLYYRSKIITLIFLIPYFAWFTYFMHSLGFSKTYNLSMVIFTLILCLIAFYVRNKKTYSALTDIEESIKQLQEFEN